MLQSCVYWGAEAASAEELVFGGGYTASTGVFLVQVWRCAFTGCTSQ